MQMTVTVTKADGTTNAPKDRADQADEEAARRTDAVAALVLCRPGSGPDRLTDGGDQLDGLIAVILRLLGDRFTFVPRGEVEIKGKGAMPSYFLVGGEVVVPDGASLRPATIHLSHGGPGQEMPTDRVVDDRPAQLDGRAKR